MKYYLNVDGTTSTFDLEGFANIETGLPTRNIKSITTLGEGNMINGYGQNSGRIISAEYRFKNDEESERESILDMFEKPMSQTIWLYKNITKRFKCSITAGSNIVTFAGTQSDITEFQNALSIYGVGISSSNAIYSVTSTGITLNYAATVSISNHELEIQSFLGRMRVYVTPTEGESYSNIAISEKVGFKLFSESPYFTSTSYISAGNYASTYLHENTTSASIRGRKASPIISFSPSIGATPFSVFQIKTAEGYGIRINRNFSPSEIIIIDTENGQLNMTVNGVTQNGWFDPSSTPIVFEKGTNDIYITCGQVTYLTMSYYEKRL